MSEPGGVSTGGVIGIVAGFLALIGGPTAIGKVGTWLADRADRRRQSRADGNREWEAKLKAREEAVEQQIADSLRECKDHCAAVTARADKLFYVVMLILPEVQRHAPTSAQLRQAKALLADILPIPFDPELPADMRAQLAAIDAQAL
ncbi:hypothetical protein Swit_2172 [Rhizorhabdus wittichii RW1]|uniref:Uncharacterized protein n=1 Tax=Rhizorhabdus wittichii (strain DSM 6014 / CCUG 31198 / JCM 15750 / NBRC 105917 / EY 4224 / RW1) TaxID=392499 RepID=A0A9J9HBH0_RHIWR|nr:hypothetical protein Swit_2172 [Rhizorhabdus wittichii RW1]